jgi:formate hydrogenlyase subunit 6/NADH:ubiquinone oxidoreductase subunit I
VQLAWLVKGLRTGVMTTRYPATPDPLPSGWRGRPILDPTACRASDGCSACVTVCLPGALGLQPRHGSGTVEPATADLVLDYGRCVMCGLCVPACPAGALEMRPDHELAARAAADLCITLRWAAEDRRHR